MDHKLYKVKQFEIVAEHTVKIWFDDGVEKTIDFKPVLYGEMWGPLQDLTMFNQVSIDPVSHTLVWSNGADFDPETLHNWDEYAAELSARAKQWNQVRV